MGAENTAPQHLDFETCKPGASFTKLTDIEIKVTSQVPQVILGARKGL